MSLDDGAAQFRARIQTASTSTGSKVHRGELEFKASRGDKEAAAELRRLDTPQPSPNPAT